MNGVAASSDPAALIRSREYRVLLVLAALVGLLVSAASWCFLEGVHEVQILVYEDLPEHLAMTPPRSGRPFHGWHSPDC